MAKGYIPGIPGTGGGDTGVPNPDPGVLADNEMVKANVGGTAIVGTGDTNTDTEVNFGSKNITTTGVVNSGAGTFRLGEAHDISSGGENVIFTNLVDNDHFYPVWVDQQNNTVTARKTVGTEQSFNQEPSKADILINPSWTSNPLVDWRVVKLTFETDTTITNCEFTVTRDGNIFYKAKLGTLSANIETTVDLATTVDNVPVDAFTTGTYVVSVTSPDGDVRLKGSTANALPFFTVGYFAFEDKLSLTEDDVALESISTSLISGGELSQNTGTTYNVAAGTGRVVSIDQLTGKPTVTNIEWAAQTNLPIPNIATTNATRIGIDITGLSNPLPFELTPATVRDYVNLGVITHSTGVINRVINNSLKSQEVYSQYLDSREVLGVTRKSGLAVTPNANLTINKSAGEIESPGAGNDAGTRGQNIVQIAAETPVTFTSILGLTGDPWTIGTTNIDPTRYDNGSGSPVVITAPLAQATIQYVYQSIDEPDGVFVMYGQTVYADLSEAVINAPNDKVQIPETVQAASNLIARIAVRADATNLSDPAQADFLGGVKFGVGLDGLAFGTVSGGGDYFGPANSLEDEIHTYADATGKVGKATSNISAEFGVIKRITANADLTLDSNGTGSVVTNGRHKVFQTDDAILSVSSNNPRIELQGAGGAVQGSVNWNDAVAGTMTIDAVTDPIEVQTPANFGVSSSNIDIDSALVNIKSGGGASYQITSGGVLRGSLGWYNSGDEYGLFRASAPGTAAERLIYEANGDLKAIGSRFLVQGTENPAAHLQVNNTASDTVGDNTDVDCPNVLNDPRNNGGNTPNGELPIAQWRRAGISAQAFGNIASWEMERYANDATNSRTKLHLKLSHDTISDNLSKQDIMQWQSNGRVDITGPNPQLFVGGVEIVPGGGGFTPGTADLDQAAFAYIGRNAGSTWDYQITEEARGLPAGAGTTHYGLRLQANRNEGAQNFFYGYNASWGGSIQIQGTQFFIRNLASGSNAQAPRFMMEAPPTTSATTNAAIWDAANLAHQHTGYALSRNTSSLAMKANIQPITDVVASSVDLLNQITPIRFDAMNKDGLTDAVIADPDKRPENRGSQWDIFGFSAEEVAQVIPQAAVLKEDGSADNIGERGLLAVAIQAIKELKARIEELEAK